MPAAPDKKLNEIIDALFQLAHDLSNVGGREDKTDLIGLKRSIQSTGSMLHDLLVELNDGKGPTGKLGA